jgi:2-oxo-4-hydroxy-4-carboxy-5-ureidoimidazoline decarboxylase
VIGAAPRLGRFNAMPVDEARAALLSCCHCGRWAEAVLARRPFADATSLLRAAEDACSALSGADWLEAFSHHPRIGERNLQQAKFGGGAATAAREQSGMAGASDGQRREFAAGNEDYERRFGHVFLICATGRSAEQMLEQLRTRLGNDAPTELANAAREQRLITRLRLERWLSS